MKKEIVDDMVVMKAKLESLRETVLELKKSNKKKDRNIFQITKIVSDIKEFGYAWDNLLDNIDLLDSKTKKIAEDKFNYVNLNFSCFLCCDFMPATEFKRKHLDLLDGIVNAYSADVVYKTATKYLKSNKDKKRIHKDKSETERLNEVWKKTKLDMESIAFDHYPREVLLQMVYEKWNENYSLLCSDYIKSKPLEEHLKDMEE